MKPLLLLPLYSSDVVKRINIGYCYRLNEKLHPLTTMQGNISRLNVYYAATYVRAVLEEIFNNGNFYGLKMSLPSATRLYNLLGNYINPDPNNMSQDVSEPEVRNIAQSASEFETALVEEFSILPSYLVTPKGGFGLDNLTNSPQDFFPQDLLQFVPSVEYDVKEAAKCIAFDVPTAAGFHLHRINEAVLRVYWDVVTKNAKRPEQRNMGVYLAELKKKKKGDAKTLAALKQIKDLHRNPILHPDETLSTEDAIDLHGMIRSAITRMLVAIRKSKPPTNNQPANSLQKP